jgi:acetyltransferase-like isoleucine patch superfamily enzyme
VVGADVKIGAYAHVGPEVVLESDAVVPERATLTR